MPLAFLSQSILHALVAAVLVEALLRVWRIEDGVWRLRIRLVAFAAPLIWLPFLYLAIPWRSDPVFVARRALFAGERWSQLQVAGTDLGQIALLAAAAAGSVLFLRDALPPLRDALRGSSHVPAPGPWHQAVSALRGPVDRHSAALGIPAPDIRVVDTDSPVLLCEGAARPLLVVSPVTIDRLGPDELDAAVAHELAHAKFRDPAWGYLLIAARALLFFNPAVQWMARALVDDIERRADQAAVRVAGHADGLARAMVVLFDAGHPPPLDGDASFERVFWRVRREGLDRRCARLREAPEWPPVARGPALVLMTSLGVFGLTFFIV